MNKNLKQFTLDSKENCILYLNRIISSFELCSDKFKYYIEEHRQLLDKYKDVKLIPYLEYSQMVDKTYNVMSYIDNLLGDSQKTSISYFKYRNYISKKVKSGTNIVPFLQDSEEIKELLYNFNKERNWQNHIPESLLVAEKEQLEAGTMELPLFPVEITHYNFVTYEYFEDLYLSNVAFYRNARKVIQFAKKEYSLLIGKKVEYPRVYSDKPLGIEKSIPTKKSAEIQGIKGWE